MPKINYLLLEWGPYQNKDKTILTELFHMKMYQFQLNAVN